MSSENKPQHWKAPKGTTCEQDWVAPQDVKPSATIGAPAPYFECEALIQKEFKKVKLTDYKGKYVVLFFYPLDFTFVCPTEIISFSDASEEFAKNNCVVLGASVDSVHSHYAYCELPKEKGGLGQLKIPLLGDFTKTVARLYNALQVSGANSGVANRATFIIDDKGNLRHASYNDLPVGRNVDEFIRLVQAFQHSDKYGEVCPAKWKPGAKTMKTDHNSEELKKFWKEEHAK